MTSIMHTPQSENHWYQRPWIISGPCSAESEAQIMQGAKELAALGKINLFRAGIWKPRTRPGLFEGIGAVGLPWLQAAKKETGLPVAIEVATSQQVDLALKHDIDVLWIGARTTVNPFSVQEIADALKGVDIPVLIKNPIHADLELWSGAVERLTQAGLSKIALVHRGFSSYGNSFYRNAPMWHLAIEMKLRYPQLPMLNDPSHICGRTDILQAVMQKAIDLDFDGLMIESHIHPQAAWSDAAQQVDTATLATILNQIQWRNEQIHSPLVLDEIDLLRQKINQIDEEILHLLAQRMKWVETIGEFKKENNITILQPDRWNEIIRVAIEKGNLLGLSKKFILNYYTAIHLESISHQKNIMDHKNI